MTRRRKLSFVETIEFRRFAESPPQPDLRPPHPEPLPVMSCEFCGKGFGKYKEWAAHIVSSHAQEVPEQTLSVYRIVMERVKD